jgi:site-specific recombinase XerD
MIPEGRSVPPTLRLHDLRNTYASRAVMQGKTLFMAGKLLGHRNLASTERYAHLEGLSARRCRTRLRGCRRADELTTERTRASCCQ